MNEGSQSSLESDFGAKYNPFEYAIVFLHARLSNIRFYALKSGYTESKNPRMLN